MAPKTYTARIKKGNETYIFLYDSEHRQECIQAVERFPRDHPDLNFTFRDTQVIKYKIEETRHREVLSERGFSLVDISKVTNHI